jgi:methanogenic corrinoid protein MtbC1
VGDDGLTAGAVARRLGVAVTTLRTWHQRYGLGPSHHIPGHHRRYNAEDLARLDVMRKLTARGVAPAEAAAWARRITDTAALDSTAAPAAAPTPARDGGGTAIPVGRAGPAARGLARAAMRLDAPGMRELLHSYIDAHGVIATWNDVVVPVLIGIGDRYQATQRYVDVEHLASRCITETFSRLRRPAPGQHPQILLACADEEQHSLPLEALAAALAEEGAPCRLLGARVPTSALSDAVDRTGPAVVVVWSQLPHTADPDQLVRLRNGRHQPLLIAAAGPGWDPGTLPAGIPLVHSLTDAVRLTLDVIEPERRAV